MRYSYNLLLLPLYNTRLNESKNEIYLIILGKGGSRMMICLKKIKYIHRLFLYGLIEK